ncbi:tRNA threonylcarbamoyladenosine biosynthesis protein TsaE [Thalassoglobus neptunius]|uniref:tRNA threonylcarbamoyladenosine biosynthesis protein TsaE n=1 Tax=Thalassoglobus neptunius TaxID=1938619 RepID=A0A5C5X5P8_9PLAN|nr:tRNA (adenosine(37)-N6)-threonylcarbamoyltransferase complex ATPase subunit type 1 TsaE [Thalassoglobus neptunius]TWT57651.1 tRNA threonylcarbamoyladenosine biosynthesis protein TsaE [Thalassoglobus neptunius]
MIGNRDQDRPAREVRVVSSDSLEQTQEFGRLFATVLRQGMVVALIGDLGAGKTHLVQSIAEAFGVNREDVSSPTFVLIQEYDTTIPICHIDAYRLGDVDEFLQLGADELLGGDYLCLIEWADRVEEALPRDQIRVEIVPTTETGRQIRITASPSLLDELEQKLGGSSISVVKDG